MSFRNAIERHLNNPPFNRGWKLSSQAFGSSNKMLNAKIKELKRQGKENVKHKVAITAEDMQKLNTSTVLQLTNPLALVRNVWFHVVLYWCRRGREGQRSLKPSSFAFEVDEAGKCYATMTHDEATKNHPGGLQDKSSYEKNARMYETDSETDGYRALKFYLSKLNPKCEALFQFPRREWSEMNADDQCWYENRPLGVNTLGSMMKEISIQAKLSKVYTNHCVRATAITLWSEAGMADRHICHISGHSNTTSLQHYNSRPSVSQLRQCSDILSSALEANQQTQQLQEQPLSELQVPATATTPEACQTTAKSSYNSAFVRGEILGGMFNSCSIQSIQINFNSPPPDAN